MYDRYKYYSDYKDLKDLIVDMLNGEDVGYTKEEIYNKVQDSYNDGNISSNQYDNLMGYIVEL